MAFENKTSNPTLMILEIRIVFMETLVQPRTTTRPIQQSNITRSTRPEAGVVKISCDTTWYSSTGQGGLSVIARDHSDNICGGRHDTTRCGSVDELEAKAIIEGLTVQRRTIDT